MKFKHLTCEQAKEIDLIEYLASINHQPVKIRNNDYWYLSPFRNERTASFKVNRKANVWFDHGEGIGGTIIDFGMRYFSCSIPDFLEKLSATFPFQQPVSISSKDEAVPTRKILLKSFQFRPFNPLSYNTTLVTVKYLWMSPKNIANR